MDTIAGNVEIIEAEAEDILQTARNKAKEILLEARKEAREVASARLNMDDVNTEATRIKNNAKEEATRKVESSHLEASKLESQADEKVNHMAEHILKVIMGVGLE